jgi:uncharacterized RDD family membrane protein YckC
MAAPPVDSVAPGGYSSGAYTYAPDMGSGEAFGRRLAAILIDGLVLFVALLPITLVLEAITPEGSERLGGVLFMITMLLQGAYAGAMYSWRGQTLGKMALGIKVTDAEGGNPSFFRGAFRDTVGHWISGWICALGFLWMLWDDQQQTWHDKLFGTTVDRA